MSGGSFDGIKRDDGNDAIADYEVARESFVVRLKAEPSRTPLADDSFSVVDSSSHEPKGSKLAPQVKESIRGKLPAHVLSDGQREEITELFESVYVHNKWRIVRMNFLRGIAFGLGTFLGGTIIVAIVVWILSQTVDLFPWARDFTQSLIDSLRK